MNRKGKFSFLFSILLSLCFPSVFSDIPSFTENTISTEVIVPTSVFAADIDGDRYIDVLSASQGDFKIVWYKYSQWSGTFGVQQIITREVDTPLSVYAADIDNDGDIDVLSASSSDDKIAWYENLDGLGTFGDQQVISTDADGPKSIFAVDIDGDGDIDILSASGHDDKIAWYENLDGKGTFGVQQIISTDAYEARSVFAADIDNDGDMDVLSASMGDDKIAWYENIDGLGTFGDQQIITNTLDGTYSVFSVDLDSDGDMDVLSASPSDYGKKVVWFENTDGTGTFSSEQIITTDIGARSVFSTDIDNDGDNDVLYTCPSNNKIVMHENMDGAGTFGAQKIITDSIGARIVFAADLDRDGDIDILSAFGVGAGGGGIIWFENEMLSRENGGNGVCGLNSESSFYSSILMMAIIGLVLILRRRFK